MKIVHRKRLIAALIGLALCAGMGIYNWWSHPVPITKKSVAVCGKINKS